MGIIAPPFSITNRMVSAISAISEKIGQIGGLRALDARPHLRRNNRIRSIHSSLAIEANSLSLDAVRAVIDGKTVIGPQNEIQEVKNAYQAYGQLGRFDPYSIQDLKNVHGIMTHLLVAESGAFRRGEEGVFEGDRCIFMAPPAKLVPQLMDNLFAWMRSVAGELHPLILSSVFHYEFVFIHPFSDGNGRMARLWQAGILSGWNPLFSFLPMESRIHAFQAEYYDAIALCHREGRSDAFIEFMLDKIGEALEAALTQAADANAFLNGRVRRLLDAMEFGVPYTTAQIMAMLGLKSRETLRRHYLHPALELGLVAMGEPDKPTSRNQVYVRDNGHPPGAPEDGAGRG